MKRNNRQYDRHIITNERTKEQTTILVERGTEVLIPVKSSELSDNQKKFLEKRSQLQKIVEKEFGGFIHMSYIKNEILYNDLNITDSNIARIIYLATFLCFSYNEFAVIEIDRTKYTLLVHDSEYKTESKQPLNKKDIQKILKLKDGVFKIFFKEMVENNILLEHDKKIYINNSYFKKGSATADIVNKDKNYTRIFIDTTRILYEGCAKPTEHRKLSKAFQIIPLAHKELNRLCYNPSAKNFEEISLMDIRGIASQLKVSTDRSNLRKLEKELLSIKITRGDYEYPFIAKVVESTSEHEFSYYTINPNIAWRGHRNDILSLLLEQSVFKIAKKKVE